MSFSRQPKRLLESTQTAFKTVLRACWSPSDWRAFEILQTAFQIRLKGITYILTFSITSSMNEYVNTVDACNISRCYEKANKIIATRKSIERAESKRKQNFHRLQPPINKITIRTWLLSCCCWILLLLSLTVPPGTEYWNRKLSYCWGKTLAY